ncbi:MAG: hypothetical protein ACRERU_20120 [Methylococcales bacterium]
MSQKPDWKKQCEQISNWSQWLAEGDDPEQFDKLRRNVQKVLPCGAEKFIQKLEKMAGRPLCYRPVGRPKNEKNNRKG